MGGGVAGGAGFAGGGLGSSGAGAVAAGGFDLGGRGDAWHKKGSSDFRMTCVRELTGRGEAGF